MIASLTQEQKDMLSVYRDKWLAIGLCTKPTDRKTAEEGVELAYKQSIKTKPKIVWCGSPLSSGLTRSVILNFKKLGVGASVRDSVGDSVRASVRDSVWDSVGASVGASVSDSVRDSVEDSVGASVGASVSDSVRDSVWDSVGASVGASVWDSVYGQHEAGWLGFYDYFNNVLKLESQTNPLSGLWMIAQSAGWFIPHENICWISERHDICKVNKEGKIHCDGGPAIHYPDGFSVWGLNGVRVSKEIAETPSEQLNAKLVLTEKNAEVRREIVRKIGVDLLCQRLGSKTIESGLDQVGQPCQLINLDLGDGQFRPFVKLLNPSIGTYHIEGVSPECDTLEKVFNFRNGTKEKPVIVT